jgi:hypothetical protein
MVQGPYNYEQETLNPDDPTGPKIKAVIPHYIYSRAYKYDPVHYENLRAVKEVLEDPKRIFWGIREHNEGGWCYVGKPSKLYVKQDSVIDFPRDKVFAVYMNPGLIVFDWCLEYADSEDKMSPAGWQERYRSLKWKSTS